LARRSRLIRHRPSGVLPEQQLLAPGVPHAHVGDDEERARLEAVLEAEGVAIDDV